MSTTERVIEIKTTTHENEPPATENEFITTTGHSSEEKDSFQFLDAMGNTESNDDNPILDLSKLKITTNASDEEDHEDYSRSKRSTDRKKKYDCYKFSVKNCKLYNS